VKKGYEAATEDGGTGSAATPAHKWSFRSPSSCSRRRAGSSCGRRAAIARTGSRPVASVCTAGPMKGSGGGRSMRRTPTARGRPRSRFARNSSCA